MKRKVLGFIAIEELYLGRVRPLLEQTVFSVVLSETYCGLRPTECWVACETVWQMVVRFREVGQVFVKSELTELDHPRSIRRGAIVRLTGAQREKPGVVRETLEKKRLEHQGT